jgi:hypothetical protein
LGKKAMTFADDIFELFGTSYEQFSLIASISCESESRMVGLNSALWKVRDELCEAISWLSPQTEREREIFRCVLWRRTDLFDDECARRMHLVLSHIEPVNADDWRQYLETFAFFKGLEVSDECEADWEEVMQAVERMSAVLMGRVAAAA